MALKIAISSFCTYKQTNNLTCAVTAVQNVILDDSAFGADGGNPKTPASSSNQHKINANTASKQPIATGSKIVRTNHKNKCS